MISDAMIDEATLVALDDGYVLSRKKVMEILFHGVNYCSYVSDRLMTNLISEFPGIRKLTLERMLDAAIANIE